MKTNSFKAAVAACWLWLSGANAAEVVPRVESGQLAVSLIDVAWPDSLSPDLKSGIENKILARFTLLAGIQFLQQIDATIFVKYDLWDEVFRVRMTVGSESRPQLEFKGARDLLAYLARLDFPKLIALDALPQGGPLTLQSDVLINPVEREKIERLRKWVAANSVPNAIGTAQSATLTSRPNDLFNRIFEQYVAGDEMPAPWKTTVISRTFDLKSMVPEAHAP